MVLVRVTAIGQRTIGQLATGQLAIGQRAIGQLVYGQLVNSRLVNWKIFFKNSKIFTVLAIPLKMYKSNNLNFSVCHNRAIILGFSIFSY